MIVLGNASEIENSQKQGEKTIRGGALPAPLREREREKFLLTVRDSHSTAGLKRYN